ncbi:peptidase U49 domain protein [Leptospira phage vb_LkmZ_Bejolso9-LE1]|nr:peptidase U49 domain protein [Leptospira phage vb_LkmZ_Bejolso9-LE1]
MKAKDLFFKRHPSALKNFVYDTLEKLFQNDSDLEVETLNSIVRIQKESVKNDLIYSNEYRINQLMTSLIEHSKDFEIKSLSKKIYIGVTNTYTFEAKAVFPEDDESLIEINFGFYYLINLYGDVITRLGLTIRADFNESSQVLDVIDSDIQKGINAIISNFNYFQKKIVSLEKGPDFEYWGNDNWNERMENMAFRIKSIMYLFVLLHEVGHHIYDHLKGFQSYSLPDIPNQILASIDQNKYNIDQIQEFEADLFAANYLLNIRDYTDDDSILKLLDNTTCSLGILITLHLTAGVLGDIEIGNENHPPLSDRIQIIILFIQQKVGQSEFNEIIDTFQNLVYRIVNFS